MGAATSSVVDGLTCCDGRETQKTIARKDSDLLILNDDARTEPSRNTFTENKRYDSVWVKEGAKGQRQGRAWAKVASNGELSDGGNLTSSSKECLCQKEMTIRNGSATY